MKRSWKQVAGPLLAVGLTLLFLWSVAPSKAHAADLGGNCCADLEERIAELEATAATKGNRKLSLTISGQINKEIGVIDGSAKFVETETGSPTVTTPIGSLKRHNVGDNSADPSLVQFSGRALITPDLYAGYVLQIGVGGYSDFSLVEPSTDTNGLYVRKSYWIVGSKTVGQASVGLLSQATENIFSETNTANTSVAVAPLSLSPITGPFAGSPSNPFDPFVGSIVDGVRYDTPVWGGFSVSASWAPGKTTDFHNNQGSDAWDAALKYYGSPVKEVNVAAAVGYRDTGFNTDLTLAASVKHIPSGIFVTGDYGRTSYDTVITPFKAKSDGWAFQGGAEERLVEIGKTTFFAEYGSYSLENKASAGGFTIVAPAVDATYWGGGIVQAIDAAAMDVYIDVRQYSADAGLEESVVGLGSASAKIKADATVGMIGAKIRF